MPKVESVPVYLPMATVHSGIQSLRAHGLPPKIDRSAWKSRSGADQAGLISGFRFLGLIDESGVTQPSLRALVDTEPNSANEKHLWGELLRQRYAKVFDVDLSTATPNQLAEAIAAYGNPSASTKKRAIRFFLKTAQYAGVAVSSRLLKDLRERGERPAATNGSLEPQAGNGASRPRRKKRSAGSTNPPAENGNAVGGSAMKTISLVTAGGTLTLNGTFNPFKLVGEERDLVYLIIDKMNEYEAKHHNADE